MNWSCETCRDIGEIDQTLGGISTSDPHCPCPDCVAPVARARYTMPVPCRCRWFGRLRLVNLECNAHPTSDKP